MQRTGRHVLVGLITDERRTVNWKRRCWLRDVEEIKVYWMAEWVVTNNGFVKAEYIGAE